MADEEKKVEEDGYKTEEGIGESGSDSDSGAGSGHTEQPTDLEQILARPDVRAAIDNRVLAGIKDALKGAAPKASIAHVAAAEKEKFNNMGYKERLKLFQSDPLEYKKLVGRVV